MKQNTEEPDYRSMNEVQLKYDLIKIEKKILDITGDPIDYKHYCPFLDWCRDDAKVEAVEEMMLDRSYILNLLFEIHCTQAEVARLEKINGMLLEMTNRTYHRTADMMRALMVMDKDDMDDDYELVKQLAASDVTPDDYQCRVLFQYIFDKVAWPCSLFWRWTLMMIRS